MEAAEVGAALLHDAGLAEIRRYVVIVLSLILLWHGEKRSCK